MAAVLVSNLAPFYTERSDLTGMLVKVGDHFKPEVKIARKIYTCASLICSTIFVF